MISPLEAGAVRICGTLRSAGHEAYLAGGCVRDRLMGREPKDYDVATSARPEDIEDLFPHVLPVGKAFGVMLVIEEEGTYEVATFRTDGPYSDGRHPDSVDFADAESDALRRDFTVNALFLDPERDRVIDFVGGQEDLKRRLIRAVGDADARFAEDSLRLMRCIRFAAQLDFAIEPETFKAVQRLAPTVTRSSAERIRDELLRMLTQPRAGKAFRLLDESGLLQQVLPEVSAMKGCEQPPEYHPEGDVFTHTMMLLDLMESPSPGFALGALLHDVGKPATQTFEDRIRFNEHDRVGAEIAVRICRRLRLSTDLTDRVYALVRHHMRTAAVPEMRESKRKRFVWEDYFPDLLELLRIDSLASHGDLEVYERIRTYMDSLPPEVVRPKPLLTGRDLMEMGYSPGPLFKDILTAVEDAQLEGQLSTPDAARAFVREHYPANSR